MSTSNPYTQTESVYEQDFTELYPTSTEFESLDLTMSDEDLDKMLINSLEADRDHWNKKPWRLQDTDIENTNFMLGDQLDSAQFVKGDTEYKDNRIFQSVRAILSYACAQLAKPDITPSKGDEINLKGARDLGMALYQHTADEDGEEKVRTAVMNLISRKRAYLKLRFDPELGLNGDIVTEVCDPEDIIIDRYARYLQNPAKIYHRIRCSLEELCSRFPDKEDEIKQAFSVRRGVYTQTSKMVTYFECWFTYRDSSGKPKEGVCWFIQEKHLILDKMANPNWVYLQSDKKEKQANITSIPPKPFVLFNYFNTGKSAIDETCLVEQVVPLQKMLNKRLRQIGENADYVNGRWIANKKAFNEEDARKLINKGARTVAMADTADINNALINVAPNQLGSWVENTVYDARNEIDGGMGTPNVFKGAEPEGKNTLGRDLMVKQTAGALQDDLVRAVSSGMKRYYKLKAQLMRVNYTDDYWFQTKGADGKYIFILINGDKVDSNVKIGVQTDSTLPLDKATIRATAMDLWNAGNAIDIRTLYEDLGLPDPEMRAERYLKSNTDPVAYLQSIQIDEIDADAESDIQLLIAKKTPEERDDYSQGYFDYFNKFLASNRFAKIQGPPSKDNPTGNPEAAQRIMMFLAAVQHTMMQSLMLQEQMAPPPMPGMPGQVSPTGVESGQQPQPSTGAPAPGQPNTTAGVPVMPPGGETAPPVPTQ